MSYCLRNLTHLHHVDNMAWISSSPPPFDDGDSYESNLDVVGDSSEFSRINLDVDDDTPALQASTASEKNAVPPVFSDGVDNATRSRQDALPVLPLYFTPIESTFPLVEEDSKWRISPQPQESDERKENVHVEDDNSALQENRSNPSRLENGTTAKPSDDDMSVQVPGSHTDVIHVPVSVVWDQETTEDDWKWSENLSFKETSEPNIVICEPCEPKATSGISANSENGGQFSNKDEAADTKDEISPEEPVTQVMVTLHSATDSQTASKFDAGSSSHPETITKHESEDDDWAEFAEFSASIVSVESSLPALAGAVDAVDMTLVEEDVDFERIVESSFPANIQQTKLDSLLNLDFQQFQVNVVSPARSGELWKQLKDLDETPALGFQWVSSVIRKSLLSSLRLNYQSAFSMGNKDPVQLDSNGPNIGSLHQPLSPLQEPDVIHLSGRPGFQSLEVQDVLSLSSEPTNTSIASDEPLAPVMVAPTITKTMAPQATIPPITRLTANGINVTVRSSEEIDDVIKRFRDISFMRSKVLVAAKRGTKPKFNKLP